MAQTINLSSASATKIRFAVSEIWETVLSLRVLQQFEARRTAVHGPWIEEIEHRLDVARLRPLLALIPRAGFVADSLTPMTSTPHTFEETLQAIVDVPDARWEEDLCALATTPARRTQLDQLRGRPGRNQVADLLAEYRDLAIAEYWPRRRALALADIDLRTRHLASGGLAAMFGSLNPQLRIEGTRIVMESGCDYVLPDELVEREGLLLVPCAFAWPGVMTLSVEPFTPSVSYASRGVGNLWQTRMNSKIAGIEALIGATRARVLRQLDLPMSTGQVADALDLSPASSNEHLKVLTGSGLALRQRDGRAVLYRRSELGDDLLCGA